MNTNISTTTGLLRLIVASLTILTVTHVVASEPIRIRVLSYNIHHAEGVDRKLDLDRIATVIRSVNPDIVALQEVDQKATRSESVDQPAKLARLTKMNVAFGANIPLQGGHYGNAVLTKFPIVKHENHRLPNVDNGEQRGVIVADIRISEARQPLVLFATHLDHRGDDRERIASAKVINQLADKRGNLPMLLAGDLNAVVDSQTLNELLTGWTQTNDKPMPTIPVTKPTRQIDFVLCRPRNQWKIIEVKVLEESVASDHRPILVVMELSGSEAK